MDSQTFQQRVSDILGVPFQNDGWKFSLSAETPAEAKRVVARIRQQQKELRLLKTDLAADIREIRARYDAEAAAVQPSALSIFGGKEAFRRSAANKKRQIKAQRDKSTAGMEAMKRIVDDLLIQLDRAKLELSST